MILALSEKGLFMPGKRMSCIFLRILACFSAAFMALSLAMIPASRAGSIEVLASIAPVHALVAAVMLGVGEPQLIISGGASPHNTYLKPSQMRALQKADIVFRIGPALEHFLTKPARDLAAAGRLIDLAPGKGDPHVWLDPLQAQDMVMVIMNALVRLDPANAARYRQNGDRQRQKLSGLDRQLQKKLAGIGTRPFLVYHDAFNAFVRRYHLNQIAAITFNPGRQPGIARLRRLRRLIQNGKVACIFTGPQFPPSLARTLVRGTAARLAVADPLGADLTPGPALYFTLMNHLADSFTTCLSK
jgi:zinc transport system substrate-binding protein